MRQWFPFYPGDYLRDTQFLTAEEHGCYMIMIMIYYSTGKPIPSDRFVLSKLFKLSPQKTAKILSTISQFFVEKDGCFLHQKIECELEKAKEEHEVKSKAGRKGGQASAVARAQAIPLPLPHIQKEKSSTKTKRKAGPRFAPPSLTELKTYVDEKSLNVDPEHFIDFYASKDWKVGSSKMKDWQAAARNWSRRQNNGGHHHEPKRTLSAVERVERATAEGKRLRDLGERY